MGIYYCKICKKEIDLLERPEACPFCHNKFFDKPENERKLFELQDRYYENFKNPVESQKYLTDIMILLEEIARNLLISNLKKKGTFVSKEEIEDMTSEVILKMMVYFRRPNFRIGDSFTGYLQRVILYPLYNKPKKQKEHMEISLFTTLAKNSEGKKLTLQDKLKKQNSGYIYSEEWMHDRFQEEVQIRGVLQYVEESFVTLVSSFGLQQALKIIVGLVNYLEDKPDKFFDYFWTKQNNEIRILFNKILWKLREFLREEIIGGTNVISIEDYDAFIERYKIEKEEYIEKKKTSYTYNLEKKYMKRSKAK